MFIIVAVIKAPLKNMVDDLCGAGEKVIVLPYIVTMYCTRTVQMKRLKQLFSTPMVCWGMTEYIKI